MRLRYTLVSTTLGANLNQAATSITFAGKLTGVEGDVPTIASPDYLPLVIGDPTDPASCEIVHLTAYTAEATTGTVSRGEEGSSDQNHTSGDPVVVGITPGDVVASDAVSTGAPRIEALVTITQTDYDALDPPDPNTVYVIVEVA